MIVLIDQDGPLADFELGFLTEWRQRFPEKVFVPLTERRSFHIRDDYPPELQDLVESIYLSRGFYAGLPPVPGSMDAIKQMVAIGHDVRICTSPLSRNEHCIAEKVEWIGRHLGPENVDRTIVAKDKTLVRGDFLIDDKPEVSGLLSDAEWEHIVFDRPYNRSATGKRRLIRWDDWQGVLRQ